MSPPLCQQLLPHFEKAISTNQQPTSAADSFMSTLGFNSVSAAAAYSAVCSAGRKLPPPEGNNDSSLTSSGPPAQPEPNISGGPSPDSSSYFQPIIAPEPLPNQQQQQPLLNPMAELIQHEPSTPGTVPCPSASTPYPYFTSPTSDLTSPFYGSCTSNGLLSSKQYSHRRQKGGRSHAGKPVNERLILAPNH